MFWNLIVNKYEKYHLSHFVMLVVLGLYSLLGALCFCALEAANERRALRVALENSQRKSSLARDRLLYDLQFFFIRQINVTRLLSRDFHTTLDYYDRLMGFNAMKSAADIEVRTRWNIWGALYFAGTIYTTIGYGDIVTETVAGKIFTVFYAIVGIPLVITVLNIWGSGLFQLMQMLWRKFIKIKRKIKFPEKRKRKFTSEEFDDEDDEEFMVKTDGNRYYTNNGYAEHANGGYMLVGADEERRRRAEAEEEENEASKLPIKFAVLLLVGWIFFCAAVFCFFEKWNFFDAAYFFFISLTTIGLGDSIVSHKVTCMYFLLILIGLAVVSMAINVFQLKIEVLFARIVKSIDSDFKALLTAEKRKHSMATSIGEERKISANTIAVNVPRPSVGDGPPDEIFDEFAGQQDALTKYSKNLSFTDKILTRMMSNHQRKLLNQKLGERRKMRNVGVQTQTGRMSAFAQTDHDLATAANPTAAQSAYYSSSEESSEEESPPVANTFAAMVAAAAVAGRRSASAGPNAAQKVSNMSSATAASAGNARRGVSAAAVGGSATTLASGAPAAPRHHRPRGLTRKKLYIYNIGD